MDSNHAPLLSETTVLPTEPQPLQVAYHTKVDCTEVIVMNPSELFFHLIEGY